MNRLFLLLVLVAPSVSFGAESGVTVNDIKAISAKMYEFQEPKTLFSCEGKGESSRSPAVIESFGRKIKSQEITK